MLHAQLGQVQVGVFKTTCCLKLDEACSSAGITLYLCSFILQQLLLSTVRIWNKLGLWSDSKTFMLSEFLILCRTGFLYLLIYVRCEVKNKVFYLYLPGSKMNRSDVLVGKTSFMLSVRLLVGIRLLRFQLRLLNQEEARGAALGFIQTH